MNNTNNYWCPIDSGSKMYPLLVTVNTKSVYRINCILKETVDKALLEKALQNVINRFPYYNVRIKSGFFWHYMENNPNLPMVYPDDGYILKKLRDNENDDFCFRITYYQNRISLEIFHALADANGALEFLKAIVYRYLQYKGYRLGTDNTILSTPYDEEESEDAFIRHYTPYKLTVEQLKEMGGATSTAIKGTHFKRVGYRIISLCLSAAEVKKAAKRYGGTVTAYVMAVYVNAVKKLYDDKPTKGGIQIMMPIDLRRLFASKTMKNFVVFSRIGIKNKEELSFEQLVSRVTEQFGTINKEWLSTRIGTVVQGMRLPILRFMPMMLKYPIFRLAKKIGTKTRQTGILSSLGVVKLPQGMEEHVESFALCVNVGGTSTKNVGLVTVNDSLVLTITSSIKDTLLENEITKQLVADGLAVKLITNGKED